MATKGVDQILMDFVVRLVVDDAFREEFQNPSNRERLMKEGNLSEEAKRAVREHDGITVERMLNTQIISVPRPKKRPAPRPKKPGKAPGKKR